MDSLKPKRRWFRFSLRTMLVFTAVVCVGLGWVASERAQSQREHAIADEFIARGARVRFAGCFDDPTKWGADTLPWWRKFGGSILGTRVQKLIIDDSRIRDLTPIAEFKSLYFLGVSNTPVNDITAITNLKHLWMLSFNDTEVTDLTPFRELRNVEFLALLNAPVKDPSPLAGLTKLKQLNLTGTKVTDLASLVKLKKLELLNLTDTQVSDEQITAIQQALPNSGIAR